MLLSVQHNLSKTQTVLFTLVSGVTCLYVGLLGLRLRARVVWRGRGRGSSCPALTLLAAVCTGHVRHAGTAGTRETRGDTWDTRVLTWCRGSGAPLRCRRCHVPSHIPAPAAAQCHDCMMSRCHVSRHVTCHVSAPAQLLLSSDTCHCQPHSQQPFISRQRQSGECKHWAVNILSRHQHQHQPQPLHSFIIFISLFPFSLERREARFNAFLSLFCKMFPRSFFTPLDSTIHF